ncbi:penicillin-binding protein 2 [Caminibacter mediatlanticus TB-2]|uniref:Penicillin-binding protein 2 n=1 Tax=Caminibacter mediatlanticus TB-2 TaxID=391592 RepID=A0ABX5VAT5_9BACT|nr:penicillin-binding protein 2 [Caminibacter mediatlanticus]QCT93906.1 penicillin-binding protein 2 [Caminibacter mediatlanticus TB-2]
MKNYRLPIIFVSFFVFLALLYGAFVFISIAKPPNYKNPVIKIKESAIRGNIYTNNYTLSKSKKLYGVYLNPSYLNPDKKELFYKLFSIYSNIPVKELKRRVILYHYKKKHNTILLAKVDLKTKQNLIYLRKILDKKRVFLAGKNGIRVGYGIRSLDFERVYPYNDTLEPFLGRYRKDEKRGENGLEEYYDDLLRAKENGIKKGYRDVFGNIIYDGNSIIKQPKNGDNLKLNINLLLQRKIEKLLDIQKVKFKAKEVIAAVMDSKTGKILAIATSNRYNPKNIKPNDIKNMKISAIRELFEPGSVMKPITFAILLENNLVNPYEIIKGYNGKWKPKWRKTPIRDDDPFDWLSAENVIVYSSNIGISQLALRLSNKQFLEGLHKFGFGKKSDIDLPYELAGKLRSLKLMNFPIYKSTTAYGYGILVNFVQILKAYNVFNNNGVAVTPRIASTPTSSKQVISPKNAIIMLNILRKVVLKGTGKNAIIPGLFTAGKTGTAHVSIYKKGYQNIYNSSFFGFVNDKNHKYTIGVTFLDIKAKWPNYFASNSAVPTFKKIVDIMINENLLKVENGE